MRRVSRREPCPICGGCPELPSGRGVRCWGFMSDDGAWAHCARSEYAGGLPQGPDGAYAHALRGDCHCGRQHGEGPVPVPISKPASTEPRETARRIWRESELAGGTVVERYLASRGLTCPIPATLRLHPRCWHAESQQHLPVMVALVQGADGKPSGLHRTFLEPDGSRKADVSPAKKMLGPTGGGAVRLAPAGPVLAVAEGIETALSVHQDAGITAWAALSAAGFASLVLPELPLAAEVIIAADPDEAGMRAARAAAARWHAEGRVVKIAVPPEPGADWNDMLTPSHSEPAHS